MATKTYGSSRRTAPRAAVLALRVRREDVPAAEAERDVVAETLDHRRQTFLVAQTIFALEAEGQAEVVDLRDVLPVPLPVQLVQVVEEAVAGGVDAEELELQRVLQPLRLPRPGRVVDDLVGEGGERELRVDHVLLGDPPLLPVLHHRLEELQDATLQDVGRRQISRAPELQDQRQDIRADPVHLLRRARHAWLLGGRLGRRSRARPAALSLTKQRESRGRNEAHLALCSSG
jgi:hypothetical protein